MKVTRYPVVDATAAPAAPQRGASISIRITATTSPPSCAIVMAAPRLSAARALEQTCDATSPTVPSEAHTQGNTAPAKPAPNTIGMNAQHPPATATAASNAQ